MPCMLRHSSDIKRRARKIPLVSCFYYSQLIFRIYEITCGLKLLPALPILKVPTEEWAIEELSPFNRFFFWLSYREAGAWRRLHLEIAHPEKTRSQTGRLH